MTLIAHGTMGSMMGLPFTRKPVILIILFLLGAAPDLAGYADGLIRGENFRWHGVYQTIHHPEGNWKLLYLIPPVGLHIFIDSYIHKPEGGWNRYGYISEVMFWTIMAGFFLLKELIKRRYKTKKDERNGVPFYKSGMF